MIFILLSHTCKSEVERCSQVYILRRAKRASHIHVSSRFWYIRECGTTLYVGLARAVPPTNINFRLTYLLTRLQVALYEDIPVWNIKFEVYHHFHGLTFIAEVNIWRPPKTIISCDLFIIIIINFFRWVFSK